MAIERATGGPKPSEWAFDRAGVGPEWGWFHDTVIPPFLLPMWTGAVDEPDLHYRLQPTITGSGLSVVEDQWGHALKSTGDSRLQYAVGTKVTFSKDELWTAFCVFVVANTQTDQRTIFAKSVDDGDPDQRQLYVRTNSGPAPVELSVERGGIAPIITGADVIQLNTSYLIALTCSGTGETNVGLTTFDLVTSLLIDKAVLGNLNADQGLTDPISFMAHFTDTNDDLIGQLSAFYYLPGVFATRDQIQQVADDFSGPVRRAPRRIVMVPGVGGPVHDNSTSDGASAGDTPTSILDPAVGATTDAATAGDTPSAILDPAIGAMVDAAVAGDTVSAILDPAVAAIADDAVAGDTKVDARDVSVSTTDDAIAGDTPSAILDPAVGSLTDDAVAADTPTAILDPAVAATTDDGVAGDTKVGELESGIKEESTADSGTAGDSKTGILDPAVGAITDDAITGETKTGILDPAVAAIADDAVAGDAKAGAVDVPVTTTDDAVAGDSKASILDPAVGSLTDGAVAGDTVTGILDPAIAAIIDDLIAGDDTEATGGLTVATLPPITGGVAAPFAVFGGGVADPAAVFGGGVAKPIPVFGGGVAPPEPL